MQSVLNRLKSLEQDLHVVKSVNEAYKSRIGKLEIENAQTKRSIGPKISLLLQEWQRHSAEATVPTVSSAATISEAAGSIDEVAATASATLQSQMTNMPEHK